MIAEWIRHTAWPMETPPPFGTFHLVFFGAGMAVAFLLAFLLRKTSERQNRAIILGIGLLLLFSEIYKQLFWYYAVGYTRYPFIIFPFHPCSIPMYLCVISSFLPDGKARQTCYDFIATYGLVGGFSSLFVPEGLSHPYWVLTIHSFGWHIVLVFLGLYLDFSGRVGTQKSSFWRTAGLYGCLCLVAFYINVGFWNISGGTIDMFFVGPAPMTVPVYAEIAKVIGRFPVTLFFMATFSLGAWLVFCLLSIPNRRKNCLARNCTKKTDKEQIRS